MAISVCVWNAFIKLKQKDLILLRLFLGERSFKGTCNSCYACNFFIYGHIHILNTELLLKVLYISHLLISHSHFFTAKSVISFY